MPFFAKADRENLVSQLTDQLCYESGGPCIYRGAPMKGVHRGLEIDKHDFNALVEVLQDSALALAPVAWWLSPDRTKALHTLLIGLGINFIGISPIQALIWTAVLYGITAPVLIGVILLICNNGSIMGDYVNGRWANVMGGITLVLMTSAAVALLYYQFLAGA